MTPPLTRAETVKRLEFCAKSGLEPLYDLTVAALHHLTATCATCQWGVLDPDDWGCRQPSMRYLNDTEALGREMIVPVGFGCILHESREETPLTEPTRILTEDEWGELSPNAMRDAYVGLLATLTTERERADRAERERDDRYREVITLRLKVGELTDDRAYQQTLRESAEAENARLRAALERAVQVDDPIQEDPMSWHGDAFMCKWCGVSIFVEKDGRAGSYRPDAIHPDNGCAFVALGLSRAALQPERGATP